MAGQVDVSSARSRCILWRTPRSFAFHGRGIQAPQGAECSTSYLAGEGLRADSDGRLGRSSRLPEQLVTCKLNMKMFKCY